MYTTCKLGTCKEKATLNCPTHGCYCDACGYEFHSECRLETIPSLTTVMESMEATKALISLIKEDSKTHTIKQRLVTHESDLSILENDLKLLIKELDIIINKKAIHKLPMIQNKLFEFKTSVYNSFIFKVVCEDYMNKRCSGIPKGSHSFSSDSGVNEVQLKQKLIKNYTTMTAKMENRFNQKLANKDQELERHQAMFQKEKDYLNKQLDEAKEEIKKLEKLSS